MSVIITPNNRLAKEKSESLVLAAMREKATFVVDAPNVLSLSTLIEQLYEQAQSNCYPPALNHVLTSTEKVFLHWVDIIRNDEELQTLMPPTELANDVTSAYRHMLLWEQSEVNLSPDSQESALFKKWLKVYRQRTKGVVCEQMAIPIVIEAVREGVLRLPEHITFHAFDDFPPLIDTFIAALKENTAVAICDAKNEAQAILSQTSAYDDREQLSKAANWAYNKLDLEPTARIAIVIPELANKRDKIISALDNVFEPQKILPHIPHYVQPYNISMGESLSSQPVIRFTQTLLKIGLNLSDTSTLMQVVTSPFLSHSDKESWKRAIFKLNLREYPEQMTLLNLIEAEDCPSNLYSAIKQFVAKLLGAPDKDVMANWLSLFEDALEAAGWPGERSLNSIEFQAIKQYKTLLSRVCTHYSFEQVTMETALFYFNLALNSTIFAPESEDSPIQVLGLLEAAGLQFDYIYLLDMNDSVFPAKASPTPFLPELLQKELGMPHADPARELEFSKALIDRYTHSAKEIIYSYCEYDRDKELSPTIFVSGSQLGANTFNVNELNYEDLLYRKIPIEVIQDEPVPVDAGQAEGTTALLSDQAKCPFSAFMKHRVKVREKAKSHMGFSPIQRGNALHNAMLHFWKGVQDQATLLSLSADALNDAIAGAVAYGLNVEDVIDNIEPTLMQMETQLLTKVIGNWLDIEKQRPPFAIDALEKKSHVKFGPVGINLRIDRVDLLSTDKKEAHSQDESKRGVIDYKLSEGTTAPLLSEKPFEDAQLPVYALAEKNVDMVGYASFKPDYEKLDAVAGQSCDEVAKVDGRNVRPVKDDFASTLENWNSRLVELANDYIEGTANITPSVNACRYCPYSLICRVSVR